MRYLLLVTFLVLSFSKAHSQEITMFAGAFDYRFYEDETRISRQQLLTYLEKDPETWKSWRQSRTYGGLSFASAIGSGVLLGVGLNKDRNGEDATAYYVGSAGAFVAAIIFATLDMNKKRDAILRYNANLERKTSFKLYPAREGIGIALHF
jgi:hypothetical protein